MPNILRGRLHLHSNCLREQRLTTVRLDAATDQRREYKQSEERNEYDLAHTHCHESIPFCCPVKNSVPCQTNREEQSYDNWASSVLASWRSPIANPSLNQW
jgi:hypothetical protein